MLRAFDIPIGDRSHDLNRFLSGEVDLHDSTSLPDMDVHRRMIEGVGSHLA